LLILFNPFFTAPAILLAPAKRSRHGFYGDFVAGTLSRGLSASQSQLAEAATEAATEAEAAIFAQLIHKLINARMSHALPLPPALAPVVPT